jgi:hypothetical protein
MHFFYPKFSRNCTVYTYNYLQIKIFNISIADYLVNFDLAVYALIQGGRTVRDRCK